MKLEDNTPLYKLAELANILRNNCPWDKEQTPDSLKPYLIEETYEVYDAIENNDTDNLKEELGDLLYQVYAHSEIASENKEFTIDDVAEGIITKLIRRHPHIFAGDEVTDKHDVIRNWEVIKKKEKEPDESILSGVPRTLPALLKAYRIQQKAARVGFDWKNLDDIIKKLDEEISEFKEVLNEKNTDRIKDEAGDILFSIVNILRSLDINPEEALSMTNNKFIERFKYIEKQAVKNNKQLNDMTLEEMDVYWEQSKIKI
jgi:tetrapyrrole methylase family protein / MazG family protein